MTFSQLLRRLAYPSSMLLPGIITIQAGNVSLPIPRVPMETPAIVSARAVPSPLVAEASDTVLPIDNLQSNAKLLSIPISSLYIQFNGMKSFLSNGYVLNPTGGEVRRIGMDSWGGGEYLARRYDPKTHKRSWHNAIDYVGHAGQAVRAPISGELRHTGSGVTGGAMIMGFVDGKKVMVRMLHCDIGVRDGFVAQGQTIGRVKNIGRWYRGMLPHVHLEVLEVRGNRLQQRNPALFVRNNS